MNNNKEMGHKYCFPLLVGENSKYGGIKYSVFAGYFDGIYDCSPFIKKDDSDINQEDVINDDLKRLIELLDVTKD